MTSKRKGDSSGGMTAVLRRAMWNEFAETVAQAANVVLGERKIQDFEERELLHDDLLMISLMMRKGERGRPFTRGETTASKATRRAAERVIERRATWLKENRRKNVPASELERWIGEECDHEQSLSGTRPVPEAVAGWIKRGSAQTSEGNKRSGMHLQEAQRVVEESWLRRRGR